MKIDVPLEIMKGSLADNSQVEQPYHTTGEIETNDAGDVLNIYIKGMIVEFKTRRMITSMYISDSDLESSGFEKDKESGNIYDTDTILSEENPVFS